MLPILRTISVGGVLLAIAILVLALSPPGRSRMQLAAVERPARGPLIDRGEHPEWRQFLILSALRRVDEINRLRELPDTAVRVPAIVDAAPQALTQLAGLPGTPLEAHPDDDTASIAVAPDATMTIEIGEPSSTELPLMPAEERPPVATIPSASAPAAPLGAAPIDTPKINTPKFDTLETVPPDVEATAAAIAETVKPAADRFSALAQAEHVTAPVVVVIRKHVVRRRAAKKTETPATTVVPPPFNFLQLLFESLSRKPDPTPAVANASRNGQRVAKAVAPVRSVSR